MAFRLVPFEVPSIDELGIPQVCKELVLKPRGLILVTGHTGAGKSTTLAAMINHLNLNQRKNIVTIEDPIEYLYHNEKSIIAQRELGDDTRSFSIALEHVLRHDPDVIVVGEMRDIATIGTAIRAAETGHLVMGTLHTTDAPQTIDRVIDIFQPNHQSQIRMQLSQVLEAVLCQTLLPRANGKGRVAAFEIMLGTSAVKNLIREGKTYEIANVMQLSKKEGMQTLEQALADLLNNHAIKLDDARTKCSSPERLMKLLHY
jgi:twitching motility protein PilT